MGNSSFIVFIWLHSNRVSMYYVTSSVKTGIYLRGVCFFTVWVWHFVTGSISNRILRSCELSELSIKLSRKPALSICWYEQWYTTGDDSHVSYQNMGNSSFIVFIWLHSNRVSMYYVTSVKTGIVFKRGVLFHCMSLTFRNGVYFKSYFALLWVVGRQPIRIYGESKRGYVSRKGHI